MKVKELITKLEKLNNNLDVVCYIEENEEIIKNDHHFRILEITDVSIAEGEKTRGDDGIASMKFGKSNSSEKVVTIEITSVF